MIICKRFWAATAWALGGALCAVACNKGADAEATTSDAEVSAESPAAAVDPTLAKAVAAASAESPAGGGVASGEPGPPPNGVFEPGAADRHLARDAAPKVLLGDAGKEPRLRLTAMQPQSGAPHRFDVELGMRVGRNMTPTITFGMLLEVPKPSGEKQPAGAAEGESTAAGALPAPLAAMVRVVDTRVDPTQQSKVPEQERSLVKKFTGSTISFVPGPNGGGSGFANQLAKQADPGLQQPLDALAETLAAMLLPFPEQPVGEGGYFMATTRESVAGIDTIAFRLVTVTAIQGNTATLEVSIKRYAASNQLQLPDTPADLGEVALDTFSASGSSTLQVRAGHPVPVEGQLTTEITALATSERAPGQRLPIIQAQITARLVPASTPVPATPGRARPAPQ